MNFFDKVKDVTYDNSPEQFLQRGSNKIFSASIIKINTLNEAVLDSEWALKSCALRLVCTGQQIRMCALRMSMTNSKFIRLLHPNETGMFSVDGHQCLAC